MASLLLIVIPGPSVLFVVGRSMSLGRRGGLLSVTGNDLDGLLPIAAVALGIGALVSESVVAFTAVKIAGGVYVAYLGIQAIRHRHTPVNAPIGTMPRSGARLLARLRGRRHQPPRRSCSSSWPEPLVRGSRDRHAGCHRSTLPAGA